MRLSVVRLVRLVSLILFILLGFAPTTWATIPTWSCVSTNDADGTDGVTLNIGSPSAGQLVAVWAAADQNHTSITTPTGFTVLQASADDGTVVTASFYKFATGSEGATVSVGALAGTADDSHWVACKFTFAHASTAPETGTKATGSSVNPDPPSLNPAGWDTEDTLWIVSVGTASTFTYTEPTGYGNTETDASCSGSTACIFVSFRTDTSQVASVDPGTATLSSSTTWATNTTAIRPSAQSQAPRSMHQYRLRRAQ